MEHIENSMGNPPPDPTILVQAMIMKKHPDWIEKHAKNFREHLAENPQLTELLKENPEEAVEEIEKIFYH